MQTPIARLRQAALAFAACACLLHAVPAAAQEAGAAPGAVAPALPSTAPATTGTPAHGRGSAATRTLAAPAPAGGTALAPAAPQRAAGSVAPSAPLVDEAPAEAANLTDNTVGPATPPRPLAPPPPTTPPPEAAGVPVATDAAIASDKTQLQAIGGVVGRLQAEAAQAHSDTTQGRVRQDAAAAQASADAFARARLAEVAAFDQQLKRYQLPSGRPRPHLDPTETRARADLLARRNQVEALARTAETAASTASGVYAAIANQRRTTFASHIFERTASPLEADFWSSLSASLGADLQRLERLVSDTGATARDAAEPRGAISLLVALLLAAGVVLLGRRLTRMLVRRRSAKAAAQPAAAVLTPETPELTHREEASRDLSRSAHAVGLVLLDTLAPGLAAVAVNLGLTWGELISERTEAIAQALVVAVFWGSAILALSRQLAGDADDALLPVSERLAARMRALPWLVALITGAGFLLRKINIVVGASLAATIAANCLVALAYAAVASLILVALGGDRSEEADADVRQPGRVLLSLLLSAAIIVTVGAVLAGFSTLALLVSSQTFWISVLAAVTYVLLRFFDDVVARLFAPTGWIGRLFVVVLNLRLSTVNQIGVLASAVVQILVVLAALSLGLTPFGNGGDLLSDRLQHFGDTVHVGSLVISPGSVLAGLGSLIVGLGLVHLVERWVDRRFLPVTEWDSGVQNSVSTGVRYLGVGLAILWALAAAGLGFKQIALVASALSVGIGFGLQNIVQNFVSGLILLVERPVKVGDWVNLGGVEGDVQRIRVRATEIRTFDRTTLIVPNSDLITKQVQNKTLGDPRGRVRLEVSVGAAADAGRAIEALTAILDEDEEVLKTPPPRVFIDSLTAGGSVNYVCFAYVDSPRDAVRIKSRLYTEVLARFARDKIGFVGGPGTNIVEPGPEMRAFVGELAKRMGPVPAEPPADRRADTGPDEPPRP